MKTIRPSIRRDATAQFQIIKCSAWPEGRLLGYGVMRYCAPTGPYAAREDLIGFVRITARHFQTRVIPEAEAIQTALRAIDLLSQGKNARIDGYTNFWMSTDPEAKKLESKLLGPGCYFADRSGPLSVELSEQMAMLIPTFPLYPALMKERAKIMTTLRKARRAKLNPARV